MSHQWQLMFPLEKMIVFGVLTEGGDFTGQRVEFLLTSVKTNRVGTLAYFRRFLLSRAHEQSSGNPLKEQSGKG